MAASAGVDVSRYRGVECRNYSETPAPLQSDRIPDLAANLEITTRGASVGRLAAL
jgi:hypothetical protein